MSDYTENIGGLIFGKPKWRNKPVWSDRAREAQAKRARTKVTDDATAPEIDYSGFTDTVIVEAYKKIRERIPDWHLEQYDDITVIQCLIYNHTLDNDEGAYACVQIDLGGLICAFIECDGHDWDKRGFKTIAGAVYLLESMMYEKGFK